MLSRSRDALGALFALSRRSPGQIVRCRPATAVAGKCRALLLLFCYGGGSLSGVDPLTITLIVGGVIVLALGGFLFWRMRPEKEEVIFHHNCPSCGRRLRYRPAQAGRSVTCPLCRKPLTFPEAPSKTP